MKIPLSAVVFDIGNVLIRWDPENLYKKLISNEDERKWFLENICTMDWNLQQDKGRPWDEAVEDLCAKFPEHKTLIEAYHHRWFEMLDGPIETCVTLLHELKKLGFPTYAISNFSCEKLAITKPHYPFLIDSFKDMVISGEENVLKPDRRLYEVLLERNKLVASELLFIDDTLRNVEAARDLGMHAIHFQGEEQFKQELVKYSLPVLI
ncbi:HAD family hydrolase [Flexibacterium corallicola]|uniref:HAD family hydrolase n=1 Tax=Flexibacterium corallicola TaxID=3037259 RepID=UPI00286F18CB|nr:HAD family phosphatase [Pseudovibrio sp. M1P-2-3]